MHKKFELWLDESGEFFRERDLKKDNKLPSLIGGFLVPAEEAALVLASVPIDDTRNHAMHLSNQDKQEYVLPILQELVHDRGLSMVFFENTGYEDEPSNRQLYLHMMAEGLLQLLQKLDGLYESVGLSVWIAQRKDVHSPNPQRERIAESEYVAMLSRVFEQKRLQRRILLNEGTKIHFIVRPAHTERRIQCADFACNTRLTRYSSAFVQLREEVDKLFETAHLFDLHESGSGNYIKICMEKGDVADAVMELFSTWEALDRKKQLEYIAQCMKNYAMHQREVILGQCLTEIEAYLYHQEDYEMGKEFIEVLMREFLPCLKEHALQDSYFEFGLQLLLVELLIKMSDLKAAEELIGLCKQNLECKVRGPEEVRELFSKEALLLLRKGELLQADALMQRVCSEVKKEQEILREYGIEMVSEGYRKALSRYIYILLPRQKEEGMYEKLSGLMDEIMNPSDAGYERLCRYRSLMEAKEGHIAEALKWLFQTDRAESKTLSEQSKEYLERLKLRKDSRDIQFGVLYYLVIADEARKCDDEICSILCKALEEQQDLQEYLGWRQGEAVLPNAFDVSTASEGKSDRMYYPMELICELREKLMR